MVTLGWIDYAIIILYFLVVLYIGYIAKKRVGKLEEYFLAGRRLTLPIFVATLVSTWYGGTLGVVELSFNSGLVNWVTQGIFWYLSYLFFALFLSKKIRESNLYTVADQLEKFYGKKARVVGAILNYVMVSPAPYFLSLGIIASALFGWPVWLGILAGAVTVFFYTWRGGFVGDVLTDALQFVVMYVGVGLVVPFAIYKFGGLSFLQANLPAAHLTFTGGWTTQMILVWGFIACWTLVDPSFYQRCYATKDSTIPKKGILISILFWLIFDFFTTTIGLYARAAMPNIDATTSLMTFSLAVLPFALKGVFVAGVLASVMSTVDSFILLSSMNIGHDLYERVFRPQATEAQVMKVVKIGMIFTIVLSVIIACFFQSIIGMFYTLGTIGISGLLVPLLFGFFSKNFKNEYAAVWSMVSGVGLSTVWLITGYLNKVDGWPTYWLGLEPLYPGLVLSWVVFVGINIFLKKSFFDSALLEIKK